MPELEEVPEVKYRVQIVKMKGSKGKKVKL